MLGWAMEQPAETSWGVIARRGTELCSPGNRPEQHHRLQPKSLVISAIKKKKKKKFLCILLIQL